ncbi:MAG TPA: iron-sulfur cluster assembly accessory protein [Verrucomicrobiae bacterium]|nr:iron-sulfur cluster assembly accessory protein [Verrucomicrobiae bacterium]
MNTEIASEPIVTLTGEAASEVKNILALPENAGKTLRLYVEKGGCSGMQYGMVFDEKRDGDNVSTQFGVEMAIDAFSADFLKGVTVDFSDALNGGGFKIKNPNAKQSCGCGKSFEA